MERWDDYVCARCGTGLRHWHLPQDQQTSKACSVIKVTFDRLHPVPCGSHAHNVARIDKCRNSREVAAKAEGSGDSCEAVSRHKLSFGAGRNGLE